MFFNYKVHKGLHKALKVVVIFIKNLSFPLRELGGLFWKQNIAINILKNV